MAPIDDDTLDRLLTRHLSTRLDGQLGRAETAFRQRLSADGFSAPAGVAPLRLAGADDPSAEAQFPASTRTSFWNRRAGWITGVVGTAVAASFATLMLLPGSGLGPNRDPGNRPQQIVSTQRSNPGNAPQIAPTADQPMVRYVYNQTWDEGTVMPGGANTPVRRVRHQQVEHMRYYDAARGAWVEVTVPKEDVEHIALDTY